MSTNLIHSRKRYSDPCQVHNVASTDVQVLTRSSNVRPIGKCNHSSPIQLEGTNMFYWDGQEIGKGATAVVYKGYHITKDKPAAIKRVMEEDAHIFDNEVNILKSVGSTVTTDNVFIVQLYEWKKLTGAGRRPAYYFAFELPSSDLRKRVADLSIHQTREQLVGYLHDAARGLKWLHEKKIIHRDIKPENILIFEDGQGKTIAKLGDFGISRKIQNNSTGTNSKGKGTSDWMSPEAIEALHEGTALYSSRRIDIFSLGLTAYFTMSGGTHPFHYSDQHKGFITANIKDMNVSPRSLLFDKKNKDEHTAENLLMWMMSKSPKKRPTISQVLNHPFFWSQEKCLKFLLDIAMTFDSQDRQFLEVSEVYDRLYSYLHSATQFRTGRYFN